MDAQALVTSVQQAAAAAAEAAQALYVRPMLTGLVDLQKQTRLFSVLRSLVMQSQQKTVLVGRIFHLHFDNGCALLC